MSGINSYDVTICSRSSGIAASVRESLTTGFTENRRFGTFLAVFGFRCAFVFAGEDVAAAAKAVKNFAKTNKNLEIKGGLMEGAAVSAAEVEAIASLPSREELIAQIAGAISGVARGLAVALNGVPSGLAQVTKAVADQKEAA